MRWRPISTSTAFRSDRAALDRGRPCSGVTRGRHYRRFAARASAPEVGRLSCDGGRFPHPQLSDRIALRWIAAGLVLASLAAGTIGDSQPEHPRLRLGGYHAMAADFHIHSFRLSWAMLATWDTVMEAQRQGPDAIAIVGHNHVWVSKSGPLF